MDWNTKGIRSQIASIGIVILLSCCSQTWGSRGPPPIVGQTVGQGATLGRSLHFRTVPRDTVVRAAQRVQLECSAEGDPPPQLSWQKDGGKDFPAARERRMLVSESGNTFYINEASVSDIGVYSCIAKNEAQTISTNASLLVYQAAHFSSAMPASVQVVAGKTAVLRCPASGYPTPSIVWNKDDQPLQISERHFLTADDQLLIMVKSRFLDAGEYSCEIKNDMATEIGYTRLEIISRARSEEDSRAVPLITPRTLSYILLVCTFFSILFIGFMLYSYFVKIPFFDSTKMECDSKEAAATKHHYDEKMRNETSAASIDLLATSRGVACVPSSTCSDTTSINHLTVDLYKDDYNPYGTVV